MEKVNLELLIQQTIARFKHNRVGAKPFVFVTISPSISQVAWGDDSLKEFVRLFLYESLQSSDPDRALEVMLTRRAEIKDMNNFVGVRPSYWVQLRVSGRGLRRSERAIEELFSGLGYHCEEWVGMENSAVRLGIFGTKFKDNEKMVFCLNSVRDTLKCDLLLPAFENPPLASPNSRNQNSIAP
jgi:hypothetical protein